MVTDEGLEFLGDGDGIVGFIMDGDDVAYGNDGGFVVVDGAVDRENNTGNGPENVAQILAHHEGTLAYGERYLDGMGRFALVKRVFFELDHRVGEVLSTRKLHNQEGGGGRNDDWKDVVATAHSLNGKDTGRERNARGGAEEGDHTENDQEKVILVSNHAEREEGLARKCAEDRAEGQRGQEDAAGDAHGVGDHHQYCADKEYDDQNQPNKLARKELFNERMSASQDLGKEKADECDTHEDERYFDPQRHFFQRDAHQFVDLMI